MNDVSEQPSASRTVARPDFDGALATHVATPVGAPKSPKGKKQGHQASSIEAVDVDALLGQVGDILQRADRDQARLTERYIEAGERLWKINEALKKRPGAFRRVLEQRFPKRYSTLREYMTLAKKWAAADETKKARARRVFLDGWGATLSEFRLMERDERREAAKCPARTDTVDGDLQVLHGDCMVRLQELPNESVDCVITSVPYYHRVIYPGATTVFGGDRNCQHDWEIRRVTYCHSVNQHDVVESGTCRKCEATLATLGWEDTVEEYIRHLVAVFRELNRVLKRKGVLWVNIDDAFADKRLLHLPGRLAIALDAEGWFSRQDVIWDVTNRAPQSALDRFNRVHEYLGMFVKDLEKYYFDAAAVREPATSAQETGFTRHRAYAGAAGTFKRPYSGPSDGMRNLRTVWSIPNEPVLGHYCAFPKKLVERVILSSCPAGGVCLDPFAGTGTVGLVALTHGRRAVLIERNAEYCGIIQRRIAKELEPYKAEIERQRRDRGAVRLEAAE